VLLLASSEFLFPEFEIIEEKNFQAAIRVCLFEKISFLCFFRVSSSRTFVTVRKKCSATDSKKVFGTYREKCSGTYQGKYSGKYRVECSVPEYVRKKKMPGKYRIECSATGSKKCSEHIGKNIPGHIG
jgi:hypothetical protein